LADLLVALQQAVIGAGGRPEALGSVASPWLAVRRALGLDGRWHTREDALLALQAVEALAGTGAGEAGDPDLDGYVGAGVCPVCIEPLGAGAKSCNSCGSAVS